MLPNIPKGRLTGLRSFIQMVPLTRSPATETALRSYGHSNHDDLECGDMDYHTHLKNANANTATQQS